jgi:hypothetical protein
MTSVRVLLAVALLPAFQTRSETGLMFSMQAMGGNVVVTASGSVNTAGLSVESTWGGGGELNLSAGGILMGGTSAAGGDVYVAVFGPAFGAAGSRRRVAAAATASA